jgi:hypothetical protein
MQTHLFSRGASRIVAMLRSPKPIVVLLTTALLLGLVPSQLVSMASAQDEQRPDTPFASAAPESAAQPAPEPIPSPSPPPPAPTASPTPSPEESPATAATPSSATSASAAKSTPIQAPSSAPAVPGGPPKISQPDPAPPVRSLPSELSTKKPFEEGVAVPGEVIGKRTQTSRTIKNADGSFTLEAYSGPIHFKDKQGNWQQIQSDLVPSERPGYAFQNKANSFGIDIKDQLGDDAVAIEVGGNSYSLTPQNLDKARGALADNSVKKSSLSRGNATNKGKVAVFQGATPGADVEYEAIPTGLKETIVLSGPEAPNTFTFLLSGPTGTKVVPGTDGALLVQDAKGKTVLSFDAPGRRNRRSLKAPTRTTHC